MLYRDASLSPRVAPEPGLVPGFLWTIERGLARALCFDFVLQGLRRLYALVAIGHGNSRRPQRQWRSFPALEDCSCRRLEFHKRILASP